MTEDEQERVRLIRKVIAGGGKRDALTPDELKRYHELYLKTPYISTAVMEALGYPSWGRDKLD